MDEQGRDMHRIERDEELLHYNIDENIMLSKESVKKSHILYNYIHEKYPE